MADIDILGKIKVILEKGGVDELDKKFRDLDKSLTKAERGLDKMEAKSRAAAAAANEGATGASKFSASLAQVQRRLLGFGALVTIFRSVKSAIEDASEATAEGRAELSRMAAEWEKIRSRVGELGARALPFVNTALDYAVRAVQTIGALWGSFIGGAIEGAQAFGRTIGAAFDFKKLIDEGPRAFLVAIGDAATRGMENVRFAVEGGVDEVVAIWKRGSDAIVAEQSEFAKKVEGEILDAQIEAAKHNITERLRLQLEALDVERRARVAAAEKANEDVARVEELYALRRRNLEADAAAELSKIKAKQLKEAEEAAEKQAEESKRLEDERAKFAQDAEDRLLKAKIDATEEGTQERLDLEIEMLRRVRDRAIKEAIRLKTDIKAINDAFDIAEQAAIDERDADSDEKQKELAEKRQKQVLESTLARLEAEAALEDEFSAERTRILEEARALREAEELKAVEGNEKAEEAVRAKWRKIRLKADKDLTEAQKVVDLQAKMARIASAEAIALTAVTAAQAIFGESKALAIAETIIATAAGIARAVAEQNYPAAALIAATGALKLAQIRSTNLGSAGGGGGAGVGAVPVAAAVATPQPVETFTASRPPPGSPQAAPGTAPGATGSDRGATIVFEGPAFIDRAGFRRLSRELDRVRQRDRASRVQR